MLCNFASAQRLTQHGKQRKQEIAEKQRIEKEYFDEACYYGTIDSYRNYLSMYPEGKYAQEAKERIAAIEMKEEQKFYSEVCNDGTLQAYQNFIRKYPNGQYAQDVKYRIQDIELWQKAKKTNTIDAYRDYLNSSKNKQYAKLANEAITELESIDAWNAIRYSTSKVNVESYISKYPKSPYLTNAKRRLDELLAVELYERGDLIDAYNKFESAGGRNSLDSSNYSKYDECAEYNDYHQLGLNSSENDLLVFIKKYPTSQHYNQVSNMVAIAKAKNFSIFASTDDFVDALSYVKDKETQKTVKSYIRDTKRSYRQYISQQRQNRVKTNTNKYDDEWYTKGNSDQSYANNSRYLYREYKNKQRHARIMANGGYVQYGFEFMDVGVNVTNGYSEYDEMKIFYYNMGASVKFGNYKAPVQLELGVKPGVASAFYDVYNNDYGYSYKSEERKIFFHMPVYAKLKINLCNAGSSKFYMAGIGLYNLIRNKDFENESSIGAGVGFAWKRVDWFLLNYKQGLKNKLNMEDKYIATSFAYYF